MKNEQMTFLEMMGSKSNQVTSQLNQLNGETQNTSASNVGKKRRSKLQKAATKFSSKETNNTKLFGIKSEEGTTIGYNYSSKKDKFYLTHIFVTFMFILVLINRAAVSSFCAYDEAMESYIVYYPEIPLAITTSSSNNSHDQNHTNQGASSTQLVPYSKSAYSNDMSFSQTMCHSSHSVLDYMALLFQPFVNYHNIVPKSTLHISAPSTRSNYDKNSDDDQVTRIIKNDMQNPSSITGIIQLKITKFKKSLHQLCTSIIRTIFTNPFTAFSKGKNKDDNDNDAKSNKNTSSDNDEEWTIYLSVPLELELTLKQKDVMERTSNNFLKRLEKDQQEEIENKMKNEKKSTQKKYKTVNERLQNNYWGNSKSQWWLPPGAKTNQNDKNGEVSGTRLLAAYLKIMNWPEVSSFIDTYLHPIVMITFLSEILMLTIILRL